MGKKNKFKNEGDAGKKPSQAQPPQQQQPAQGRDNSQPGPSGSQAQKPPEAQKPQQQAQKPQQQAQKPQQQAQQQGAGQGQQQGAQKPQQPKGSQGGQQGAQKPQQPQGAWGGQQQHGQAQKPQQQVQKPQQQAQQQGAGQGQQQGVQKPQQPQGSWGAGGQQHGQAQQRQQSAQQGSGQQQGSWSGGQGGQPQRGQGQQQGAWGGQKQHGQAQTTQQPQQPPQQGRGQQQVSWGGGQGGPPRGQGGQGQQGSRGGGQQQRGQGPPRGGQQRQPVQSMERSFQQLSVSNEEVLPFKAKSCVGIERGTLGRPGSVEINYLKLDIKNMPNEAYHYDVTITPDIPKKFLRPAFDQCNRELFPNILAAYDGRKSCYTVERLATPIEHTVQVVDSGSRMKDFKVEIKETGDAVVDLNSLRTYQNESISDKPMRAIQALDVVLSGNNHERGIRVGRSFFRRPQNAFDLEGGFEAWTGLFQAAILGEQPFLNVDIAHKSFPRKSSLIEYLVNQNIRPEQDFNSYEFKDVQRFLKGLDIVYESPPSFGATPKKYRVLDIGEKASKIRFKNEENQEMTVLAYFESRGYRMRYPNLPCVKTGSTVRSIYLPMELCSIPEGQALNRKDGDKQVQKMIRYAATSTNTRKEKIMDILNYYHHNDSPIIRAFGVQIGSQFIKVPIRNLPSPTLEYMNGRTAATRAGAWRMDGMQFLATSKPQGGHKWGIIYEESRNSRSRITYHTLNDFKNDVLNTSKQLNMNLEGTAEIIAYTNINATLRELAQKKYALVFVVLGNFGTSYAKVKQNAELEVGILTQCIKENTVQKTSRDRTVFSNILLKVNGKLNGTNHKISNERDRQLAQLMEPVKNVMYLGADVTHPSPDQRHIPSVVGVAASHDSFGACYNMQYRLQRSTREDIEDMESIVTRHLEVYKKYQKSYPQQIIYYRDGVSDGQFPIIKNVEIRAIKNACAKLRCNPKLTVVIVVKRHHTRFFPMKEQQHERDFNNVEPGTVVDQHITHPNEIQFFMVSHQSIQGTAKPTRYNVILDESKFNINLLQKLTYNLCHMFPRCNRVVSYPAPAYLAHLVAFRGRVYLEGSFKFSDNLKKEYERRLIKSHFMESNPMYFI